MPENMNEMRPGPGGPGPGPGGPRPGGPGPGGFDMMFPSNSDDYTRAYYESLLIEPRYVGSEVATTKVEYFGKTYETPIMIGPFPGMVNKEGNPGLARAAQKAGTLYWGAHLSDSDYEAIREEKLGFVDASKPLHDPQVIRDRIIAAEKAGATAFYMDIDHIFSSRTGDWEKQGPNLMGRQTVDDLRSYAECSGLPVIMKGILSVHDAVLCREAGISGIVLSHHHGMLLYSVPPALALSSIRKAVGPDYTVFIDCSIESGIDAFKALALGADGVLVARHFLTCYRDGGSEALANRIAEMTKELRFYLSITGSADTKHIDPSCIIPQPWNSK